MKKPNCLLALQINQLVSPARWLEHNFSICGMNHKSSLSVLKMFLFKRWCNKKSTSTFVYTTRNSDLNIILLKAFQFTCHTELELFQFKSQSLKHLLIKKDMADTVAINELCLNGKLFKNCTINKTHSWKSVWYLLRAITADSFEPRVTSDQRNPTTEYSKKSTS